MFQAWSEEKKWRKKGQTIKKNEFESKKNGNEETITYEKKEDKVSEEVRDIALIRVGILNLTAGLIFQNFDRGFPKHLKDKVGAVCMIGMFSN